MKFNVKNFITLLLIGIVSLGLVIGCTFLINPQIEKKEDRAALEIIKRVNASATDVKRLKTETRDGVNISLRTIVYEKDVEKGYAFIGSATNEFGEIEIIAYIEGKQIIEIKFLKLEQTLNTDKTRNNLVNYLAYPTNRDKVVDGVAGATFSSNTVDKIIKAIVASYKEATKDQPALPYETWFGSDYEITATEELEGVVTKIETIGTQGFVYTASKVGIGHDDNGIIEIQLMLDANGKILGYQFGQYDHSGGSFQTDVETYLEALFTDKNIKDIPDDLVGGTTPNNGSGNSTRLVVQIIHAIKAVFDK